MLSIYQGKFCFPLCFELLNFVLDQLESYISIFQHLVWSSLFTNSAWSVFSCFFFIHFDNFLLLSITQIYVPTNPRGAELLPPGIVVPQSDLYLRRLWGDPSEV